MEYVTKKIFHWSHLQQLHQLTNISDNDNQNTDPTLIHSRLKSTRSSWKTCKKHSSNLRKQLLNERAEFFAKKIRSTQEKAVRAIIKAEASRRTFSSIRDILGNVKSPLTQVVIRPSNLQHDPFITLTQRSDIEFHIMQRNHKHSLQAHVTPFLHNPILSASIDPAQNEKFDDISKGPFVTDQKTLPDCLSPTEHEWVRSLQKIISTDIQLDLDKKIF